MENTGAQPLRHLRTSCRALRCAASGAVSVSVAPVYNAADFVCALSHPQDKCSWERLRTSALRSRTFPFSDEAAPMEKMLLAADVLMVSSSSHAAQEYEAVYARSCGACHNGQLPTASQKRRQGCLGPSLGQKHGRAGTERHQWFECHAAAWPVHGLHRRGLPSRYTVDDRVNPAHAGCFKQPDNSFSLSRSWISR